MCLSIRPACNRISETLNSKTNYIYQPSAPDYYANENGVLTIEHL